jgi:sialic acid synthase SpsE
MLILEVGINHFGKLSEAKKYLDFFLKSNFKYLTFQIQTESFYNKFNNQKLNFELPLKFYSDAIKKAKKKKKYIGLAVCDINTYYKYNALNFSFYKLLGIAINNYKLIDMLALKKKEVFISLAKANDRNIINCINRFNYKVKINLIYTSISYDPKDLNLKRINYLKDKFKIPVGYGHHYKNEIPLFLSKHYSSSFSFIYVKKFSYRKNRVFPDDTHAFFLNDLMSLNQKLEEISILINNNNINTKIKLSDKKIQF